MNFTNPFFIDMRDAIKEAVEARGAVLVEFDSQFDAAKQMSGIEDLINQKVDGIILNPVDTNAVVPAIKKANEANIPVVTVDVNAADGEVASFIASDNVMAGRLVGEYIVEKLHGKGDICVIDYPIAGNCVQRIEGLMAAFEGHEINILGQQKGGSVTDALRIGETWVQKFPKVDAIFGINDQNAIGALTAFETANRQDELFVVGVDGIQEAYDIMKSGRHFGATSVQQPKVIGTTAVETIFKVIAGESVEKEIQVPVYLVTQEDILSGKVQVP
jgi:ribose transport system substrate-binding protein